MNRFFDFSRGQLRIVIILAGILLVVSAFRLVRSYSSVDRNSLRFTLHVGDSDNSYAPVFKVDLNISPADSLELIPGIGPVLASRITAYRDSIGRFEKPEDIINVYGIGFKTYEKIKSYIEVRPW